MSSANASTSTKKPKEKGKKKEQTGQTSSVVTPHGRNEGSNTDWEYKPPPGAVLVDHSVDAGEFDYDSLKGQEDHLEMWIIRVPDAVCCALSTTGNILTFYPGEAEIPTKCLNRCSFWVHHGQSRLVRKETRLI